MAPRLQPAAVATFLAQTPLFRGCSGTMLAQLAPHLDQTQHAPREQVLTAGGAVPGLGIVHTGRVSVRFAGGASVDEVGPGDCFGEAALLLGGQSPYGVVAEDETSVLWVRKDHFDQILAAVPAVSHAVAKRQSSRFVRAGTLSGRPADGPTVSGAMRAVTGPVAGASAGTSPVEGRKNELRFVEVGSFQITPQVVEMLPSRLIQQVRCFPLEIRGRTLVVGMVNPFAMEARQELRRYLHNVDPEVVAISADDWAQACIRHKLQSTERPKDPAAAAAMLRFAYQAEQKKADEKAQIIIGEEVINLLDRILSEAVERGASDVHIEPDVGSVRVRLRIQGMIHDRKDIVPPSFAVPLVARIKVLAELDITERRLPQDGRIVAHQNRRELNFRVSTIPTARGEKAVIRILDAADVMRPFNQIFVDAQVSELVHQVISGTFGAIFVAGATGSGKSTTLYSMVNQRKLLRPDNNIVTVEDPIEFPFPGLTQVPVNARAGLDYPTVLRSLLRQDPDVIVVGELRDAASAGLVLEASLTGHLVMATIHGGSVLTVLQRLEQFGATPMLLSQALNAIVVQRLARRLCPSCAREEEVAPVLMESLVARGLVPRGGSLRLPRAVGCELCDKTGFLGRVAVVEVLSLQSEELRVAMAGGVAFTDILQKATATNQFLSTLRAAKLLMARKILSPADALLAVSA